MADDITEEGNVIVLDKPEEYKVNIARQSYVVGNPSGNAVDVMDQSGKIRREAVPADEKLPRLLPGESIIGEEGKNWIIEGDAGQRKVAKVPQPGIEPG